MSNKLYSVAGIFDTPDGITKAAAAVADAGYGRYDVHTPYPVHGMDDAMRLKPSRLGYFTIVIGFTCMFLMLYFIYWTNNVDYPQIIGGKPFFALPSYVPIMFEITILTGAVLTVAIMIAFFFKLPNNSHPLHDTQYMKDVSSDKYGVSIEAADHKFAADEVRNLLVSLGALRVDDIYFDEEEVNHKNIIFEPKFLGGLAFIAVFTSFSAYMHLNKLLYMDPFHWMESQSRVPAQNASTFFADGKSMREPVKGTVARGFMPYTYEGNQKGAAQFLSNPLEANEFNMELGKKKWLTFCSPCHGNFGQGDSRLHGQFPNGPTMHSDKVRGWTDGDIYHVITNGQNVMPSYAKQVTRDERWAIVMYVRALQRSLNANEGDLK